jgi:prolyl-tRNA synthetase
LVEKGPLPDKFKNFSEWYDLVLEKAELADSRYGVKGFVVYRPNLMHVVREIYETLERHLIETDHKPMLFPLLIPYKNLMVEKEHVKGFEKHVFLVEKAGEEKLDENLFIRPTSETAIYPMYSLWIRSYRDLPFKAFQSCAVYRYETKATRPLLRGREFLWIESHNAFADRRGAEEQLREDLEITRKTFEEFALPFLPIEREWFDRFPGAERSLAYDSVLPDKQVLQSATTHLLGKRFTEPFQVRYLSKDGKKITPESTCFGPGVSRIAALIIAMHGDEYGLILPFKAAPIQIIIVPIQTKEKLVKYSEEVKKKLKGGGYRVEIDQGNETAGEKFYRWEMRGVPVRVEVGEKEVVSNRLTIFRRDLRKREIIEGIDLLKRLKKLEREIHGELTKRAQQWLDSNIDAAITKKELLEKAKKGGFIKVPYCGKKDCADEIKTGTGGHEVRGKKLDEDQKPASKCIWCGDDAIEIAYLGKAY